MSSTAFVPSLVRAAGTDEGAQRHADTVSVAEFTAQALSALAAGEKSLFFTPAALVANSLSLSNPTWTIFDVVNGGVRAANAGYVSCSINLEAGSRITAAEYVIGGTVHAGSVTLSKAEAGTATASDTLFSASLAGSGIIVYSTPQLNEVVDATHTYEAYYYSTGTTSFCKGIRVRYVPPSFGLTPITPLRVYDSRFNMTPDTNGPLSGGANRTLSVINARNPFTGVVTGATAVPASATAIAYTLTVVTAGGGGFLAVNPGGNTTVSASSINWSSAGQVLANTGVVKINSSRQVTVIHGGGGSADFIIDIVGYY